MNVCKILAAAAVLSAAMCQAARLAPSSSTYAESNQSNNSETAETAKKTLEPEDAFSLSFEDDFPETINGYEVLSDFLPDGVSIEWTGKKMKTPKAGKVKYSKEDEAFVDKNDSENPSGLSVKYDKKKKKISGSFKVYVAKSETKLKSYKAKFSGEFGDTMPVYVKGKRVATVTVE